VAAARLDVLLMDKTSRNLVAKQINVFINSCQKRLRSLFFNKIIMDKASSKDYTDVVMYVIGQLEEMYSYPDVVKFVVASYLARLIEVVVLILNEPKILQHSEAYLVVGGLRGLMTAIFVKNDLTAVVRAHLKLITGDSGDRIFKDLIRKSLDDLCQSMPDQIQERRRSFNVEVVIREVKDYLADKHPIDAVKPLLVVMVKLRGPVVFDSLPDIKDSDKADILGSVLPTVSNMF
jgi:hypothetical protein